MWDNWNTGRADWDLGEVVPTEVLYYLNGPAIFTCRIGLATYLFYKSDEGSNGDYFVATEVSEAELDALRDGRLSVRGALSHRECWLFEIGFSRQVLRYERTAESTALELLPPSGVPLISSFPTAADSLEQTDALFAFKFFGREMSEEGMPFSTFKGLVDRVYDVVRGALTPLSLSAGRDRRFLDFPLRQPKFASLLIAIDPPSVDAARLRARDRTRGLDPTRVEQEAQAKGVEFADQVERLIELAVSGKLSDQYAADNFEFLSQIIGILPMGGGDVSRLQFSSAAPSRQGTVFVEIDADVGDRIREYVHAAESRSITLNGFVSGILDRSKTFRLTTEFGREVTCSLTAHDFNAYVERDLLKLGARVSAVGKFEKRTYRDRLKVEDGLVFY